MPVTIPITIVMITIVVITVVVITSPASAIASATSSAADAGSIAVAGRAPRDRQDGDRGDVAECGRERGDETAQRQPAREAGA
jgi:hypothetical protein